MLKNETSRKVLVKDIKFCRSIFSKASGLMFRKKLHDKALVFLFNSERLVPLHNMFVFQAIDVLFLDKHQKVAEICRNFKPFTLCNPKKPAQFVIELPAGSCKNVTVGDRITFK